ncbi:polyphosphate kinase [bacterium]|nr:MAG: polyphosphate kinase [bacterium]
MIKLSSILTTPDYSISKKETKKEFVELLKNLFELQNKFYADGRFGLLVILQGMDTSGKDGTIRNVFSCMNPQGVQVKSFKKPTEEELKHDFLWRVYPHIPAKGMVQIFNRSYYEDILIPIVRDSLDEESILHRCEFIRKLEQHFALNNIIVLKFYLNISQEEQKIRKKQWLLKPHKRWKYSLEDEKAASKWDSYISAYDMLINNCVKPMWNIIPSDKKWYRNYLVAKILNDKLEKLDLKYPITNKE